MDATRCLREEHQVILKVLGCFEIALRTAQESNRVDREVFEPFVTFFRGFADRCHHCKEEDRLFPQLERKGMPREGGPIGVMIQEHELGRLHVRTIAGSLEAAAGGDADATRTVLEHGHRFLALLRAHIDKEDHCLFGMADQLIHDADLTALADAYRDAESDTEYRTTFDECRAIADRLAETYGGEGLKGPKS
jgi:hemerythrin-like domain-containing protein